MNITRILTPQGCVAGRTYFSHIQLFTVLWTVAHQSPMSMEFSRSGLPFLPLGDLSDPGMEPTSLMSLALAGRFLSTVLAGKCHSFNQSFDKALINFKVPLATERNMAKGPED